MTRKQKMIAVLRVYWRMVYVFFFYPVTIGAFLYVYVKGYHWIFGLLIIIIILLFDPVFRILRRGIRRKIKRKKRAPKKSP